AFQSAWNTYVCNNPYGRLTLANRDATPASMTPVTVRRDDSGATTSLVGTATSPDISTSVTTSLIANMSYTVGFTGTGPQKIRLTLRFRSMGDWVRTGVPYTSTAFFVYRDYNTSTPLTAAASLAELDASQGDKYFLDTVAGLLYVKLRVQSTTRD